MKEQIEFVRQPGDGIEYIIGTAFFCRFGFGLNDGFDRRLAVRG